MAGRIPQEFLDRLLARTDIVELVETRVPLKKAGREFSACCPFHSEKTPSFTVSPAKQFYHCFGCGAHGNAIGFLMEYEHLSFPEAVEELARIAGLELPQRIEHDPGRHDDLLEVVAAADRFFRQQLRSHPQRQRAIDYLRRRGVDGETAQRFGIGYAPPGWDTLSTHLSARGVGLDTLVRAGLAVEKPGSGHYDRFRDRIMFPIRDRRGRTVAFGGRILDQGEPKYLNSPETPFFQKGQELYGLYEARTSQRQLQRLLVVEGYMDVVALAQAGLGYAVATLGTATTAEHVDRLFRLTRDVVFCFDGDRAGREAAWRALENTLARIREGRMVRFLFLPEGEDPDSMVRREGAGAFEGRLDTAQPLSEYLFQHLIEQSDMSSLDGRARLAELARPLIGRMPESVFRDLLTARLAELTGVSGQRLGGADAASRGTAATARQTSGRSKAQRTPVRVAMALLFARPDLGRMHGSPDVLRELSVPGVGLLAEMIETVRANPHITHAGGLLEHFRDHPDAEVIRRVSQLELEIADALHEGEFVGALGRLESLAARQGRVTAAAIDKGLRGARPSDLTEEEREALRMNEKPPRPPAPAGDGWG